MDLSSTIEPRSDQINADDLIGGPRTVTITEVTSGSSEQPVNIVTVEWGKGRPYKPSKTMRRLLVMAWGKDSTAYVGRRLTIYREPTIRFGKDEVGGIRISHMSHIDKRLTVALTVSKGKRQAFSVDPLPNAEPERDWAHEIESATTKAELRALWSEVPAEWRDAVTAAVAALDSETKPAGAGDE